MDIAAIKNKFFPKKEAEKTQEQKAITASNVLTALGGKPRFTKIVVPARIARKYIACSANGPIMGEYQNFHNNYFSDTGTLEFEEIQPGYIQFTFSEIQLMHYIADLITWRNSSPMYSEMYQYEFNKMRQSHPEAFVRYHKNYNIN